MMPRQVPEIGERELRLETKISRFFLKTFSVLLLSTYIFSNLVLFCLCICKSFTLCRHSMVVIKGLSRNIDYRK